MAEGGEDFVDDMIMEDIDYVNEIIVKSEKYLCKKIANVQHAQVSQASSYKKMESDLKDVQSENSNLRRDVEALKSELDTLKAHPNPCTLRMDMAFSAALKAVHAPVHNPEQSMPSPMFFAKPVPSGTSSPFLTPETAPSTVRISLKRKINNRQESPQIYTDFDSLPEGMKHKLEPFSESNKFSTRDLLNQIQRAFVKYKVVDIKDHKKKMSDTLINEIIQEGIQERIWLEEFNPSPDITFAKYLMGRIKNERKQLSKQRFSGSTDERLGGFISDEQSSRSSLDGSIKSNR